jgi:hypothetical protein
MGSGQSPLELGLEGMEEDTSEIVILIHYPIEDPLPLDKRNQRVVKLRTHKKAQKLFLKAISPNYY